MFFRASLLVNRLRRSSVAATNRFTSPGSTYPYTRSDHPMAFRRQNAFSSIEGSPQTLHVGLHRSCIVRIPVLFQSRSDHSHERAGGCRFSRHCGSVGREWLFVCRCGPFCRLRLHRFVCAVSTCICRDHAEELLDLVLDHVVVVGIVTKPLLGSITALPNSNLAV